MFSHWSRPKPNASEGGWVIYSDLQEILLITLGVFECINCSCQICEPAEANKVKDEKEDKKKGGDAIQGASSGEVTRVWVGTGAKVAPQQVEN